MAEERPLLAKGQPSLTSNAALYIVHLMSFTLYAYAFFWHFGSEAAKLPQAQGFGSFTQYLTSCTFFFHTFTLLIVMLSHRLPEVKALGRLADDLSCAVFAITHVCNFMFWLKFVFTLPPSPSEPGEKPFVLVAPPFWLVMTLHALSSVIAALDLLLAQRSFSKTSWNITRSFCGLFVAWFHICTWVNKRYPYPFMNAIPQPQSTILISVLAYAAIRSCFRLGSRLANSAESSNEKDL